MIGQYTEKWCKDFLQPIAEKLNLFAVNNVVCPELGLNQSTSADIAFCTTNDTNQIPNNIKIIFEIKMSIVNNYSYDINHQHLNIVGDYKSHKGVPSILRSDSMLKAIGKSINIRVSSLEANKIPILILANSPISKSYVNKVDFLKKAGVIQGFVSLYPNPTVSEYIKETPNKGFQTFFDYEAVYNFISSLINSDMNFFSSMIPKQTLGNIITIANQESNPITKAEKFLHLLNQSNL